MACGSSRDCCERKESSPMIGAELELITRLAVIAKRSRVVVVAVPAIFASAVLGVDD